MSLQLLKIQELNYKPENTNNKTNDILRKGVLLRLFTRLCIYVK